MKFFKKIYRSLIADAPAVEKTQGLNEAFLHKAQQKIYENLQQEGFDVEAFCRAMAISRTQLHNKLKALTGLSTTQFIRKTRVEYACDLLKDPEKKISEVAYDVGFQHTSSFNRAFQEFRQQSPSEYRDQLLSDGNL